MRRKDKEISDPKAIEAIIHKARVCRLAMVDGTQPYIIPLSFGYRDHTLYFHSSPKGRKVELLQKNPNVCFEFDLAAEILESDHACNWSMKYQSVIGFGKAVFIKSADKKRDALKIIMGQYSDGHYTFPEDKIKATALIKIEIESLTGKQSGF